MRNLRMIIVPLLILAAISTLAMINVNITAIAHFVFIWDILLGAALGAGLALLPALSGFPTRRNAQTGMLWVCGFISLLLIFYQYMTLVTGMHIDALTFLASPNTRMRIVEGAVLGYTSLLAGRGKL